MSADAAPAPDAGVGSRRRTRPPDARMRQTEAWVQMCRRLPNTRIPQRPHRAGWPDFRSARSRHWSASTSAALCWVISSICRMAVETSGNGVGLLAAGARDILDQLGAFLDRTQHVVSFWVASATSLLPTVTSLADCSISTLTSDEALAADWARRRTSTATTAKPLPASPARAASTEAFSARRLVWKAMSSISPMMLEILDDDVDDPLHRLVRPGHHLAGQGDRLCHAL